MNTQRNIEYSGNYGICATYFNIKRLCSFLVYLCADESYREADACMLSVELTLLP
jgi:hypothetical protein